MDNTIEPNKTDATAPIEKSAVPAAENTKKPVVTRKPRTTIAKTIAVTPVTRKPRVAKPIVTESATPEKVIIEVVEVALVPEAVEQPLAIGNLLSKKKLKKIRIALKKAKNKEKAKAKKIKKKLLKVSKKIKKQDKSTKKKRKTAKKKASGKKKSGSKRKK